MDFKTHLKKYLSDIEINKLISSFDDKEKKGIILNINKMNEQTLLDLFPNIKKHPVVENGYIFDKDEIQLGKKVYHELGAYYVQEPSAMMVTYFLDPKPEDVVLDLCAAPGGKTIQAAIRMQNKGQIIANDLSKSRANILLSNIERLGIANAVVTSLDFSSHSHKFENYFDKIILDAPCSGSGMFRKSDEMKQDWTYEKVVKNAAIQKDLILMCYSMLKEGGTMVYSTCSYSFEEDEEVIEHLLSKTHAELINIPSFKGEFRSPKYKETVHLFPSHFDGEGHYIALIHKPGNVMNTKMSQVNYLRKAETKGGVKAIENYSTNVELPKGFEDLCLRPGLFISTKIGDKNVYSHHYSRVLDSINSIELTKEELVKYLKGETLQIKNKPDGYYFVHYMHMNAGLVHIVNGLAKNLYPKGLRINADIKTSF